MRNILLVAGAACFVIACEDAAEPLADDGAVAQPATDAEAPAADAAAADAADAADAGEAKEPELPERRFVEVRGEVDLDGEAAAVDMEIGAESTLETGKDGYAIITVEKGSTIEVRGNTSLRFGKSETAEISVALAFGTLWSFMADDSSYEVVTANTVAGVRGTIFFVQVEKPKKKKKTDQTYVCACHGKVGIKGVNPKSFDDIVHSPSEDHKALMPYMEKTR